MVQNIIVWVIGVFVFALIIHKLYTLLRNKDNGGKCSGCSGCDKNKNCDK